MGERERESGSRRRHRATRPDHTALAPSCDGRPLCRLLFPLSHSHGCPPPRGSRGPTRGLPTVPPTDQARRKPRAIGALSAACSFLSLTPMAVHLLEAPTDQARRKPARSPPMAPLYHHWRRNESSQTRPRRSRLLVRPVETSSAIQEQPDQTTPLSPALGCSRHVSRCVRTHPMVGSGAMVGMDTVTCRLRPNAGASGR
jgi:hypothetical protein